FFVPGNGRNLQTRVAARIKHCAAELKADGHFAICEAVKVFGRSNVEIEGAGHGDIRYSRSFEGRHDDAGVSPQKMFQSLTPTPRLVKKIAQPFLIFRSVFAAGDFKLNLASQRHRVNHLFWIRICEPKLESKQRRGGMSNHLGALDLEAQI